MRNYAAIMGMFPFFFVLLYQQDSMLALLILIGCWFALNDDSDVLAGLILGLALFKFQIIIPLALVLAFWRPKLLKGFALSGVAVFALSVAMVRPAGMIEYWRYLVSMASVSYTTTNAYHMSANWNVALRGLIYALLRGDHSSTHALIPVVTAIVGVLILGVAWRFMRISRLQAEIKFSFALITALLLSFHLLPHDLILLSLPFILLAGSMARWPLAVLYVATIPWSLGFPRDVAWFALLPMSSLAVMMALYWRDSSALLHILPRCSSLLTGITRRGRDVRGSTQRRVPPNAAAILTIENAVSAVADTLDAHSTTGPGKADCD
jgi:hypothetical protein